MDTGKKNNETSVVALTFGPLDRCAAILASLFISFHMKATRCQPCLQTILRPSDHTAEYIVTRTLKE